MIRRQRPEARGQKRNDIAARMKKQESELVRKRAEQLRREMGK